MGQGGLHSPSSHGQWKRQRDPSTFLTAIFILRYTLGALWLSDCPQSPSSLIVMPLKRAPAVVALLAASLQVWHDDAVCGKSLYQDIINVAAIATKMV